mgnify:CR=1 FL=1
MTMSFTLPEIELNVPTSTTAEENDAASNSFSVKIDSTGAFFIDLKKLTLDELQKVIEQEKPQSITLYLDPDSPAQSFIDVSDLARTYTSGKLFSKSIEKRCKIMDKTDLLSRTYAYIGLLFSLIFFYFVLP